MRNDYTIEEQFLADTSLSSLSPVSEAGGEPPLPEKPVAAGAKIIPLTEPELLPDRQVNFLEIVELRSTVRQYSQVPVTAKELSYLLWCTQGVKMGLPDCASKRNVPSAGARHPFETYLYIQNVEGLPPGLYRYLAYAHALLPMKDEAEVGEAFRAAFCPRNVTGNSAVTFVWGAVAERMTCRFGARAYRYLFLDAGHVCQNLYLAAQTVKMGVCGIGTFYEDKLHPVLGLDGKKEFAVYAASAGKL